MLYDYDKPDMYEFEYFFILICSTAFDCAEFGWLCQHF